MPDGRSSATAVVLLQLGGPDRPESVEPFLRNLFSDPDIIDMPGAFLFRRRLARWIASRRAPAVREYYRRIGGGSPLRKLTLRQAHALEAALAPHLCASVHVAMRYWHPMTAETARRVADERPSRLVLLPLYPQYSRTTTGSSVREWRRVTRGWGERIPTVLVEEYCDHPLYVRALVRNITRALLRVRESERSCVHLLFSAHGTPLSVVRAGDPYQGHVRRTYEAVCREGAFGLSHSLCYQSRVGPRKWLGPSLEHEIVRLAEEGRTHLLVVPVSFVSDHSETLWEINMQMRAEAVTRGIRRFDMMPALNTNPLFIAALADCVRRAASS
ncbi:MAG: ferrochelatase [Bacteroidota bacterium]